MYQRIFVPVDDSETSNLALHEACHLAKEVGASLKLVHVVDLAQFGWGGTEFLDATELQKSIKQAGEQVLGQAGAKAKELGVTADCKILESWGDKIAAVLVDDAGVWGADLIVMGTHGWSGLMHLLMGSVAEGVLKLADVPVLLVRNPGD
ncbi:MULTISPECIES: universal stress protein [Chromobacterium]|uniref:universal stress protein n=1 Tax=Chromobacterium TaxID=535 RepID=UPI000D310CF2|nr:MULTISPECIES: universal stress protein [Chromobacterium]MCP1288846.1 universal stress protein [Chromobacterium sp. S0633]PTU64668.1 universal stress protein [Chromobacterium sp. Panama]